MSSSKLADAKRKEAWKATKEAVGAYARNPCRATEIEVGAALDDVKHLCTPCAPKRKPAKRPKKQ